MTDLEESLGPRGQGKNLDQNDVRLRIKKAV